VHETGKESAVLYTQQTTETLTAAAPEFQRLSVQRRDRRRGALLMLVGEIDLDTAPQLDQAVRECLRAGIHTIDIDLTHLTFCDISGLNALLDATWLTTAAGGCLRLENPCPMLTRLLALTGIHARLAIGVDDAVQRRFLPAPRTTGRHGDQ
jgi:anti-sigma B factor antagonist